MTSDKLKPALDVLPSDLARLTEDGLGDALAKVRAAIKDAEADDLGRLRGIRGRLTKRLDNFVLLDLEAIDRDPKVKAIVDQLAQLTLDIQTAAKEMRTVKKTIDRATEILGYAEQFLKFVGKFA